MPNDEGNLQWTDEKEAEAMIEPLTRGNNLETILKLVKYYLLAKVPTTKRGKGTKNT